MASAQAKEATGKMLRSILLPEKTGLLMQHLPGVYTEMVGKRIAYGEFGFRSLEAYLRSMPDVVSIRKNADGSLQCFGVADASTAHIKSLVARQKSSKKSRARRPRPKPAFRSRAPRSRPGPIYRSPPSRPAAFPRPTYRCRPPPPQQHVQRQNSAPVKPPAPGRSSQPVRPFSSTHHNIPKKQEPPPPNKPSFGNHSQGFVSTSTKPSSNWGGPAVPKSSSKVITQPPPASNPAPPPPPGGKSAFVSVVAQENDIRQQQEQQQQVSKPSKQSQYQQPQRVLAPRFLKKMQKELEEQKLKDMEKENQRKQQAQNLATEHNNNMHRVNLTEQQDLRITVPNDKHAQEGLRITVPNDKHISTQQDNDNNNDNIETSPAREEWPARRQIRQEKGDWRSVAKDEERSVTPVSTSSQSSNIQSFASTSTPPPSPAPDDVPYCNWFKKELDCKTSGLWRSGLDTNFKKDFGESLTDDIIQKMAGLKILTVEKVFNQEIVYPNLKIETKPSSTSRTVVVNGNATRNQRHHSDGGSASPVQNSASTSQRSNSPAAPQRSQSVSSDTTSTLRQSPLQFRQSPIPSSPTPSNPSPTVMGRGGSNDGSAPDYSHLAVPLPEDEVWEVYVSYIKHLQDFYVLIVDEEYTDKLFSLEEEMGHYYKYSRRRMQGPPAEECIYAAELNKEWLRVMVDKVHNDHVECFLVDHGDTERVEVSKLQPLAPQFLHTPFQAIPCKLEGSEDDPENPEAVQKFCEVALGQVLYAEPVSKEDAQVELVMYDEDAVATINDLCIALV